MQIIEIIIRDKGEGNPVSVRMRTYIVPGTENDHEDNVTSKIHEALFCLPEVVRIRDLMSGAGEPTNSRTGDALSVQNATSGTANNFAGPSPNAKPRQKIPINWGIGKPEKVGWLKRWWVWLFGAAE